MSGDIEALGDAITGGVVARAVEPEAGETSDLEDKACLNCGTALTGHFCHHCGQKARVHRTLSAFWHDLLHAVFHFDGKFFRTIPMLALKPGDLTRRYIHGERAKFVSPLALFLFTVFLMFAVMGFQGTHLEMPDSKSELGKQTAQGVSQSREELAKEVAAIDAKIAAAEAKGQDIGALKRERANVSGMLRIMGGGPTVLTKDEGKLFSGFQTGSARLDEAIKKANENPNLLLYKLQSNAYKFSWALIPLSVPFVWLLFFWRRKFKLYDHAIFVTYSLSFMSLMAIVLMLVSPWIGDTAALIFMIVAPIHIYKQMKGTYELSRAGALIRTLLLLNMTMFVVIFFVLLLITLGVMG